jgi:large subunit ribosomal protein L10
MARLSREEKIKEIERLAEAFKKAKTAIFALYRGLSVREMTGLRRKMREKSIEIKVVKTSLLKRALDQDKLPLPSEDVLSQPIAVVFSFDDEIMPAKILAEAQKESAKLTMLAGYISGKLVQAEYLDNLASLPGREELVLRLVGTLANLPRRLVWSANFPGAALTNILRQQLNP